MTIDELYDQAVARNQPNKLSADTASLKSQFAGPQETMGQAVQADKGGIANFLSTLANFTNPSNTMAIAHHAVPMGLQVAGTALGGAGGSRIGQALGSGAGSLLGYLFQSGAEPMMKGEAPTTSLSGALGNAALGTALEGGAQVGGAVGRTITGKTAALREGEAAGQEALASRADIAAAAGEKAAKATESAAGKVESAQGAVNREILKHSEDAFQGVKEAEVERLVKENLGPEATVTRPVTIESLTKDTAPAQKAAQKGVQGVFDGISAKYDQVIEPYGHIPIPEPSLRPAIKALREDVRASGQAISPSLSKLLSEAAGDVPEKGGTVLSIGRQPVKYGSYATTGLERARLAKILADQTGAAGLVGQPAPTVKQMMGLKSQFVNVIRTAKNGVDRRTAAAAVDAIQSDIAKVLPPEVQPVIQNLDNEWHQAKSTFSDTFRSRLFRASSPEQVAEAIYTGARTGKQMGHRAELLANQLQKEAPEQFPAVQASFARMISQSPTAIADIQKMPPSVFKAYFPGTGFDTPQGFIDALNGGVTMQSIGKSPELMAKWDSAFKQGMGSLGTRTKQAALDQAERNLKDVPGSTQMMADALKDQPTPGQAFEAGAMQGMKEPIFGKGLETYAKHRFLFHTAFSIAAGTTFHSPWGWFLPLGYLGSSKIISAALSNPKLGRMYYNALTSKSLEQKAFWMGRTVAAGLTESTR